MEELTNKEIQRRRMMAYFIEAASRIIEQEGVENLSLRKVAKAAGYNSATLYNYFKDIEHLSVMASMKYLRDYTVDLANHTYSSDPLECFMEIWDIFCDNACKYPRIFYTIFFNKHSNELNDTIREYYKIFPEELGRQSGLVNKMLLGQTILERDMAIMVPLVENGYLEQEEAEFVNEIIISCYKEILYRKCNDPNATDAAQMKAKVRAIIRRLIPQK